MKRTMFLVVLAIATVGLFGALTTQAYAYPTYTQTCFGSSCHNGTGPSLTVELSSTSDTTATYSITTGGAAWSVFNGATQVVPGSTTSPSTFDVAIGSTYTVYAVGTGGSGVTTLSITPAAPTETTYTITASAGLNGSINPSGAQTVTKGDSMTFTITPSTGYAIASVLVNGTSVGATSTYTFSNVTADHTISATFAAVGSTYTLTYTADSGGTITGTSPQIVGLGSDGTTVTAVPDDGYSFTGWSDGVTTAARRDTDVIADHSVTANFSATIPTTYTLTYTAGTGGTITGTSPQTVDVGSDGTTVTAVPNAGYSFTGWSDGVTTATRVDTDVEDDLSVTANFSQSLSALKLTIASDRAISTRGHAVKFSGTTSPNVPNGTKLSFQIRKLGSTKWTTVSVRSTFSSHHWSYTLSTKNRKHGAYFFRVKYAGTAYLGAVSPSKKLSIR